MATPAKGVGRGHGGGGTPRRNLGSKLNPSRCSAPSASAASSCRKANAGSPRSRRNMMLKSKAHNTSPPVSRARARARGHQLGEHVDRHARAAKHRIPAHDLANPVEPPWYGPVCPVVGEGWHREVSPYPDLRPKADPHRGPHFGRVMPRRRPPRQLRRSAAVGVETGPSHQISARTPRIRFCTVVCEPTHTQKLGAALESEHLPIRDGLVNWINLR